MNIIAGVSGSSDTRKEIGPSGSRFAQLDRKAPVNENIGEALRDADSPGEPGTRDGFLESMRMRARVSATAIGARNARGTGVRSAAAWCTCASPFSGPAFGRRLLRGGLFRGGLLLWCFAEVAFFGAAFFAAGFFGGIFDFGAALFAAVSPRHALERAVRDASPAPAGVQGEQVRLWRLREALPLPADARVRGFRFGMSCFDFANQLVGFVLGHLAATYHILYEVPRAFDDEST